MSEKRGLAQQQAQELLAELVAAAWSQEEIAAAQASALWKLGEQLRQEMGSPERS
jgi:hypothetical protein